jgi:hypothetical protein
MNFAMIPRGLPAIHDQPIGTFQALRVQFALCLVISSDGGNVLAGTQPFSLDDRFPSRCDRDENLRSFDHLSNAFGWHNVYVRESWR